MQDGFLMKRLFSFALVLGFILLSGCAVKDDRCWVDDYRYNKAKEIYEKTQTLDLVRYYLEDQHDWRLCEINEVLYRLKKEYHLDREVDKLK